MSMRAANEAQRAAAKLLRVGQVVVVVEDHGIGRPSNVGRRGTISVIGRDIDHDVPYPWPEVCVDLGVTGNGIARDGHWWMPATFVRAVED